MSIHLICYFTKRAAEIFTCMEHVRRLLDPRLSGDETTRAIRLLQPEVPIIISSGYSERDVNVHFSKQNLISFIPKPFPASQLVETVRLALEQQD